MLVALIFGLYIPENVYALPTASPRDTPDFIERQMGKLCKVVILLIHIAYDAQFPHLSPYFTISYKTLISRMAVVNRPPLRQRISPICVSRACSFSPLTQPTDLWELALILYCFQACFYYNKYEALRKWG